MIYYDDSTSFPARIWYQNTKSGGGIEELDLLGIGKGKMEFADELVLISQSNILKKVKEHQELVRKNTVSLI